MDHIILLSKAGKRRFAIEVKNPRKKNHKHDALNRCVCSPECVLLLNDVSEAPGESRDI